MFFNASIDSVWQVLGSPAKTQICILFPRMIKRNLENQIMGSSSTVSFCLLKTSGLNYLSSGACRLWGSSVTPSLSTLPDVFLPLPNVTSTCHFPENGNWTANAYSGTFSYNPPSASRIICQDGEIWQKHRWTSMSSMTNKTCFPVESLRAGTG